MSVYGGPSAEVLVRRIVESSIGAVTPSTLFEKSFRISRGSLNAFGIPADMNLHKIVRCVAIGKSAEAMAFEVRKVLGSCVSGIIATPVNRHLDVDGFEFMKTGHPFPDERSLKAGEAVERVVAEAGEKDLLLFLISGGGTASIFVPVEGVTLEESNRLLKFMLDGGVPIDRINLVRRHLSRYGGGKLSQLALNRKKISFVISDVVGDDLSAIAGGPTVKDDSSPAEALEFLEKSGLLARSPGSIKTALLRQQSVHSETQFDYGLFKVIASNRAALSAAEKSGIENGFNTTVMTRYWESDPMEAAKLLVSVARSIELDDAPTTRPALVLAGGETTVRLTGNGIGGRNQHLVLSALYELAELHLKGIPLERTTIFSFGTDGKDGSSEAAGAFASLATFAKVNGGLQELEDYIRRCDSNNFFAKYGGLINTGPTDTNVMDVFGIIVV